MVWRVVIVFKMKESKKKEEVIACHYVWIKWSAVLLLSGPIIFEAVMLVMPHLNYKFKKCVHFLDGISGGCAEVLPVVLDDMYWQKQWFVLVRIIWKTCLKKRTKIEKGEDSAFISEAPDRLTPFGDPVKFKKFDESLALVARNATSVSSASSSSSEDEEDCTWGSTTSSLSSNSSSMSTSSISSRSSDFEYSAHLWGSILKGPNKIK